MPVAITTAAQDVYPPRVQITVTGLTVGDDVILYRQVAGTRTEVRAGTVADIADTSLVRVDAELPFGVPVTYVVVVNGTDEYTDGPDTHVLPGGKVALSDAITGLAAEVIIMAWPERTYPRRVSVFQVGGFNRVIAGPLGQPTSTVELFTETTSQRDNLAALLANATEAVIQIRQPGGYDGVDCYAAVLDPTERRFSQDGTDQRRLWSLPLAEVPGWSPQLEARGYTLGDLADAYDGLTLDDLSDDHATLLAIAQADYS